MPDVIQIAIQATDAASKIIGGVGDSLDKLSKQSDDADKKLKLFGMSTEQIGNKMTQAGKIATVGLTLPIAGLAVAATKAASDLNETSNKIQTLFGNASGAVVKFADTAATSLGQSKKQALDAAADFAVFGKAAGLAGDNLVTFSKQNVQLAADMASFFNTSPEEAITAIGAAFRGESEPIRRYGVLINDASLKDQALRMGLIKTTTEALQPQARVLAAQALILQQTAAAQGDFAKTSDGLANQSRILNAQFQDMIASLGQSLLPIAVKVAGAANDLLTAFNNLDQPTKDLIVGFGLMAAAAGPVLTIGGKLVSTFDVLSRVSVDAVGGFVSMGRTVGETAGYLKEVGVSAESLKFAFQNLKAGGALLGVELGVIVAGLIAIGKYLDETGKAARATTEDLIAMSHSGDVFKQAAATTEILAHGQDRLKVALDGTHEKIRAGAKDYADYKSSIEATAKAAGYEINAQGNLVQVINGTNGRVEKLVQSNYLLSESNYKVGDSQNFVTAGAGNQAQALGVLGAAIDRAKVSAQTSVTATQAQAAALKEYYTATRDANAEGLIRANDLATQSIEVLKTAMAGAVGKEMEQFKAKQDELQAKAAELQGVISTSYGRARDDAVKSLGEINTQLEGNAKAHEEATRRILFDIASQQLATVQDPQIRAKAMNELALQWGLVDKATYDATENIIAATNKLASDSNVNTFKANLESIANKQLGITPISVPVEPKIDTEAIKAKPLPTIELPVTPKIDVEAVRSKKIEAIEIPVKPKVEADTKGVRETQNAFKSITPPTITPKVDSAQATKDIQTFTAGSIASIPKETKTVPKVDTEKATKSVTDFIKLFGTIPKEKTSFVNVDGVLGLQTLDDILRGIDKLYDKTINILVRYKTEGEKPTGYQFGGSLIVPPNPSGRMGDYFPILAAPGERVTVETRAQQHDTRTAYATGGDTYNYNTNIYNPMAAAMWADQQRRERLARSNARMGVT